MAVTAITEEFWTVQYRTGTLRSDGKPQWWPPHGDGHFETEDDAMTVITRTDRFKGHDEVRIVKVVRSMTFGIVIPRGELVAKLYAKVDPSNGISRLHVDDEGIISSAGDFGRCMRCGVEGDVVTN